MFQLVANFREQQLVDDTGIGHEFDGFFRRFNQDRQLSRWRLDGTDGVVGHNRDDDFRKTSQCLALLPGDLRGPRDEIL